MQNVTIVVLLVVPALVLLGSHNFASGASSTPNIFEILAKGGDITFIGAGSTTKMTVIGPPDFDFSSLNNWFVFLNNGESMYWDPSSDVSNNAVFGHIELPDGVTVTAFECKIILDVNAAGDTTCSLYETPHGGSPTQLSLVSTSQHIAGIQTLSDSSLNHLVDRDANRYHAQWKLSSQFCFSDCQLFSMKITYTVPSGFAIGGEFYPVDNVSLILAYGLVNSWWMAPIGIGLGVGIYLVKRKI